MTAAKELGDELAFPPYEAMNMGSAGHGLTKREWLLGQVLSGSSDEWATSDEVLREQVRRARAVVEFALEELVLPHDPLSAQPEADDPVDSPLEEGFDDDPNDIIF